LKQAKGTRQGALTEANLTYFWSQWKNKFTGPSWRCYWTGYAYRTYKENNRSQKLRWNQTFHSPLHILKVKPH